MIYVEKKFNPGFLSTILNVLVSLEGGKFVLWKYTNGKNISELLLKDIEPYYAGKQELETVTQYFDASEILQKVDCYRFNQKIVTVLTKYYDAFLSGFDSISVYREDENKWISCIIFHEQMTLLRISSAQTGLLKDCGISYSDSPPDWW